MNLSHRLPPFAIGTVTLLAVLYLTLMPQPVPPEIIPPVTDIDKAAHALMFFGLTLAWYYDLRRWRGTPLRLALLLPVAVASALLGGIIELLQGTNFINRSCDVADAEFDAVGAAAAFLLWWMWPRRQNS